MSLWLPAHPCQEIQSARGLQTASCYVHLLTSTWIHSAVFWWEVLSVIGFQSPGFSLPMGWYMGSTSRNVCLVFLPCLIPSANVCYKTFFQCSVCNSFIQNASCHAETLCTVLSACGRVQGEAVVSRGCDSAVCFPELEKQQKAQLLASNLSVIRHILLKPLCLVAQPSNEQLLYAVVVSQ